MKAIYAGLCKMSFFFFVFTELNVTSYICLFVSTSFFQFLLILGMTVNDKSFMVLNVHLICTLI